MTRYTTGAKGTNGYRRDNGNARIHAEHYRGPVERPVAARGGFDYGLLIDARTIY